MNDQDFDPRAAGYAGAPAGDTPTPEQAAILFYLELPFDPTMTRAQAAALISRAEDDPAARERLQSWHHDKYRLHPDLFTPPQRSFREARGWQVRVSDDTPYGRSFKQPSLNQAQVVLEALDAREPGWEREAKNRRETRFLNELATLSPELRKPGCPYPHALPAEDLSASAENPSSPTPPSPPRAPSAPSAPFVPGTMPAPGFTPPEPLSKPAWTPEAPLSIPVPPRQPDKVLMPAGRSGGKAKWPLWLLLLAGVYALGAGGYAWWHRAAPDALTRADAPSHAPDRSADTTSTDTAPATSPKHAGAYKPVAATESRRRALAKYPELARAGSLLNAKFIASYRILESQRSPRLLQEDWPERLADEFAAAPAVSKTAAASPTPAAPKSVPAPPKPAASKAPSPAAATPGAVRVAAIAPPAADAAPPSSPAAPLFVTLDAVNKTRANNYTYHWSPYYYAEYDISFRQTVGIEAKVRNMTRNNAVVNLRWMFFGRKTSNNERYVFSAAQKRVELAAGQTVSDVLDSPMLQSTAAVGYSFGTHYYSGSKYEGWLVQVLPEEGDQVLKQVGSSGYIEDYGKRPDLTTLLKQQLGH